MQQLDVDRMHICLAFVLCDVSEQNRRRPEIVESLRNSEMFPNVIQIYRYTKRNNFINCQDGMQKLDVDRMHICLTLVLCDVSEQNRRRPGDPDMQREHFYRLS